MNAPIEDISKFLDGSLAKEKQDSLSQWRNESEENEIYFQEVASLWKSSKNVLNEESISLDIHTEKALKQVQSKLSEAKVRMLPKWPFIATIAASFVIIISSIYILQQYLYDYELQIIATTKQGETFELPDGSTVWLEPNSELSFAKSYTDERAVEMKGEIYFDVERDEKRPFSVTSQHADIKVLGTSFVVSDRPQQTQTSVSVLTGKVSVTAKASKQSLILTKNMTATIQHKDHILKKEKKFKNVNHLYQGTNALQFENTSLQDVFTLLESYSEKKIVLANKLLENCSFTGTFKDKNIQEIIVTIQPIYNFIIKENKDSYIISNGFCAK